MRQKENLTEPLIFIIMIVFTGYAFSYGLDGVFLLDDLSNIGPAIVNSFDLKELVHNISDNTSGIFGRPISILSFSMTSLAHADSVWAFKYHNILLHLLTGITIYCLSKRVLSLFNESVSENYKIALLATSIWLLHPLQVSTVMYAVQRMTQLSALFSFMALILFLRGIQSSSNSVKIWHYFIFFPITLAASMLSKENGVLTPLFVLLILVAIYFSTSSVARVTKQRFMTNYYDKTFIALFILLPLCIGALGFMVKFESFTDYSARPFSLVQRAMAQIDFVFLYLNQLVLPRLSAMGLFFDDIAIPTQMTLLRSGKLFILVGLLIGGIFAIVRGKSILGLGILFYFSGHLLESTIIPLELAFEHRNYLPSLGIFLAIAYLVLEFSERFKPIVFIAPIWLLMLTTLLFLRLGYWSDINEWHKTILAYHPKSERTQLEYIHRLSHTHDARDVIKQIDKARQLLPDRLSLHLKRLSHSCRVGNAEENREVVEIIQKTLLSKPLTTIAFNALGELVNFALYTKCNSVSKVQAYVFVRMAQEKQAKSNSKSARYGYLKALQAKMEVSLQNHRLAHSLYLEGFELTGHVDFVFWAITVLLANEDTRDEGYIALAAMENNKYFYAARYQHRIDQLKNKIAGNNFHFIF